MQYPIWSHEGDICQIFGLCGSAGFKNLFCHLGIHMYLYLKPLKKGELIRIY